MISSSCLRWKSWSCGSGLLDARSCLSPPNDCWEGSLKRPCNDYSFSTGFCYCCIVSPASNTRSVNNYRFNWSIWSRELSSSRRRLLFSYSFYLNNHLDSCTGRRWLGLPVDEWAERPTGYLDRPIGYAVPRDEHPSCQNCLSICQNLAEASNAGLRASCSPCEAFHSMNSLKIQYILN
jgi:hypothetical protein